MYMSNKHPKVVTISGTADGEAVAWSSLDHFYAVVKDAPVDPLVVAGGVLVGDDALVSRVLDILTPPSVVDEVEVLSPGVRYAFTENRDTPADVAAAFVAAGEGRTILDANGWDALYASGQLGDDGGDNLDTDDLVIH